jgi:hypothetical protein
MVPRCLQSNWAAKSEGRSPKAERRPKTEARTSQLAVVEGGAFGCRHRSATPAPQRSGVRLSRNGGGFHEFGVRPSAFFRVSAFGFRISSVAPSPTQNAEEPGK